MIREPTARNIHGERRLTAMRKRRRGSNGRGYAMWPRIRPCGHVDEPPLSSTRTDTTNQPPRRDSVERKRLLAISEFCEILRSQNGRAKDRTGKVEGMKEGEYTLYRTRKHHLRIDDRHNDLSMPPPPISPPGRWIGLFSKP